MPDVVVVGASIAGATTAIRLARLGHSVQLIDRAQFPRRKACGEGLFPPGVAELDALGLLPQLLPQAHRLESLRFEMAGRSVEAQLARTPRFALGIQRNTLDNALLELARTSGVDVRLGVRVDGLLEGAGEYHGVSTEAGLVEARVVVVADGARSRLRQEAGLDVASKGRRYGVSAHFELSEPPLSRVDVRFRRGHEVYVTPVGGRLVNVAVLLHQQAAGELGGRLTEGYRALVEGSGGLGADARLVDEPLATGPFPAEAKRAFRRNLILVGDAAGFYDGITGEGMSLALVSARHCAAVVDAFLKSGSNTSFEDYDRLRRALARPSHILGALMLALASQPRLAAFAIGNLARRPQTFEKLIAINQGASRFSSLRPRDLMAALLGI